MQGDWRVTVVVARESNDANNRSRRESLKAVARGGAAALMWPVTRSVEAFVKAVRMTERQGRRLRPTPHRRSTVLPRFDRGSLLVGALSPLHAPGWRPLKSQSTGDGRLMKAISDAERARQKGTCMPGVWRDPIPPQATRTSRASQ